MTNKNRYVLNQIRQVAKSSVPDGSNVSQGGRPRVLHDKPYEGEGL